MADNICAKALDGLENAAGSSVARAKAIVPVRTGKLRDSITSGIVEDLGSKASVDVYSELPYAFTVEMGSSKQAPQPYLRPAIDADEVVKDIYQGEK